MACANIFSAINGRIVRIEGDQKLFQFSVAECGGGVIKGFYEPFKAICTSIGIQGQGGYQFMHTLSDFIYLYVFNERVGQIVFSGLAFAETCKKTTPPAGIELLLTWYDKNRVTSCESAIIITIGSYSFTAFLTSFKIDIINPENGIAQFSFIFNYVPNQNPADPCGSGSSEYEEPEDGSSGEPTESTSASESESAQTSGANAPNLKGSTF